MLESLLLKKSSIKKRFAKFLRTFFYRIAPAVAASEVSLKLSKESEMETDATASDKYQIQREKSILVEGIFFRRNYGIREW